MNHLSTSYIVTQTNKTTFTRVFEKYYEIFQISYKTTLAYFIDAFSRVIDLGLRLLIYDQLYTATYMSMGADIINNLRQNEVVWIIMFVQSFHLSKNFFDAIMENIKTGQITVFISKPFYYPLFQFFDFLGDQFVRILLNLLLGSVITFILVGGFDLNLLHILYALPLAFGAITLGFTQIMVFALLAFWIEDSSAFFRIYSKLDLVLGGSIFPPALFPVLIQKIAMILPFANMFYIVGETVVKFDKEAYIRGLGVQFIWIFFFSMVILLMYKKGTKRLVLQGG